MIFRELAGYTRLRTRTLGYGTDECVKNSIRYRSSGDWSTSLIYLQLELTNPTR